MTLVAIGFVILGAVFLICGVAMLSMPAAFVLAGAGLVAVGLVAIDWED